MEALIDCDIDKMDIPNWYVEYEDRIAKLLPDKETIKAYCIYHDIGKCFSSYIDENGKRHFPNHAEISKAKWLELASVEDFPDKLYIAELIGHDMLCHEKKFDEIMELNLPPETLCTLLLSALASIHANADSFGGRSSDSYKIKRKRLDTLAKKILQHIFKHEYVYIIVRNDLSPAQRTVQSCHAAIEATKNFNMNGEHPSVIACVVKSENKLKQICNELSQKGMLYSQFYELDIGNQLTAIATAPISGETRKMFERFQLLN